MKRDNMQANDIVSTKVTKNKQLLSPQSSFDVSYRSSRRASLYNALEDQHASRYFISLSVKKHLESMAKVHVSQNSCQAIDTLPKSSENQKVIRVMSRLASLANHNRQEYSKSLSHKDQSIKRSLTDKNESCQAELATRPIKIKKSPYYSSLRPKTLMAVQKKLPIRTKNKKLSRLSLPPLETYGLDIRLEKKITYVPIKSKLSLAADCRAIDKLHRLRHNHFQSFLSKKREQLLQRTQTLKLTRVLKGKNN